MLYVIFDIEDPVKFEAFQKLYDHMVKTRQPDFEFEEEEEPEIDWETITDEEYQALLEGWRNEPEPEEKRYKELFPDYAHTFLQSYIGYDKSRAGEYGFNTLGIFNYLEFSFETDMNNLEKLDEHHGKVEFSPHGFPYGGMERFLMVLKAFGLTPTECYNGFTVYKFNWTSDFTHEAIELPKETEAYRKKLGW